MTPQDHIRVYKNIDRVLKRVTNLIGNANLLKAIEQIDSTRYELEIIIKKIEEENK